MDLRQPAARSAGHPAQVVGDLVERNRDGAQLSRALDQTVARTLRLANSAMFLVGKPCDSVNQAILRVGTKTLYEMMAAVAVLGMFEDVRGVGLMAKVLGALIPVPTAVPPRGSSATRGRHAWMRSMPRSTAAA